MVIIYVEEWGRGGKGPKKGGSRLLAIGGAI